MKSKIYFQKLYQLLFRDAFNIKNKSNEIK